MQLQDQTSQTAPLTASGSNQSGSFSSRENTKNHKNNYTTKSTGYDTAMSTHKVPCSPTPGVPTVPQESQGLKVGLKPEKRAW